MIFGSSLEIASSRSIGGCIFLIAQAKEITCLNKHKINIDQTIIQNVIFYGKITKLNTNNDKSLSNSLQFFPHSGRLLSIREFHSSLPRGTGRRIYRATGSRCIRQNVSSGKTQPPVGQLQLCLQPEQLS